MKNKEELLQETIVQITSLIYPQVYEKCECFTEASAEIIRLAKEFEEELNWQDDDERDYLLLLEDFCDKYLEKISYVKQEESIYDCYEEIKQREIRELKERVKTVGGRYEFNKSDAPYVLCKFDSGPADIRIVSINEHDQIFGYDEDAGEKIQIYYEDIAYGNIEFITNSIPTNEES